MSLSILEREMFSEAEAARLLQVSQATLHWWLEGGERRGWYYRPVIRAEPKGSRVVTWAEFVEAGLLRQYRRAHGIALWEIRVVIDKLRERTGVPYPLAHAQPFIGEGPRLVLEVQDEAKLKPELCLVAVASGQPVLTSPSESFVQRVEWSDDVVIGWRPHADPKSPVLMTPDVRFGLPAVGGIRTEIIWEHLEAEETIEEVAEQFSITSTEVRWALAYETSRREPLRATA